MEPGKTSTMLAWPRPQSISAIRGFLGLTRYYRCFIKGHASITTPLTNLLRKDSCIWNSSVETTFVTLKDAMTTTPVLSLLDFSKPFTVETDASGFAIGDVLTQDHRHIAFFSKRLSSRMQHASSYSREMFAITTVVTKSRQYLLGCPFTILTNRQSLHQLVSQTIQTPEQQKWLTKLLGFEFTIIYKFVVNNKATNALSRWFLVATGTLCAISRPIIGFMDRIRAALLTNPTSKAILEQLNQQSDTYSAFTYHDIIIFFKGRIYVPDTDGL